MFLNYLKVAFKNIFKFKLYSAINIIGWLVAWLLMEDWLNFFAFLTEVTLTPFIMEGSTPFVFTFITISARAIKAARQKPVMSFMHE